MSAESIVSLTHDNLFFLLNIILPNINSTSAR
jgi:hypothetical protein